VQKISTTDRQRKEGESLRIGIKVDIAKGAKDHNRKDRPRKADRKRRGEFTGKGEDIHAGGEGRTGVRLTLVVRRRETLVVHERGSSGEKKV